MIVKLITFLICQSNQEFDWPYSIEDEKCDGDNRGI